MLSYAAIFLGMAFLATVTGIRKIEAIEAEQLKAGFLYGLALAVVWTTFGLMGALCLGKFLVGFTRDFQAQELLVRYYDRLKDLGKLPRKEDQWLAGQKDIASGTGPERMSWLKRLARRFDKTNRA